MESEAIAALVGAVVGGALTILGNLIHEAWRDARQAEQLAHAIAGEVSAILEVVAQRQYLEGIREHARLAHGGQTAILAVQVTHDYFSVIESNLDRLGMLPAELPILIPRFLTLSKAVLEDFAGLRSGHFEDLAASELGERYDELAALLEAAVTTGRELVNLVAATYGSPHGRYPLGLRMRMTWWRITGRFRPKGSRGTN